MTRLRRQLAPLVPTVAALFALCIAAPRAPLVFHTHAAGEHTHTHGDADLVAALAAALERGPEHGHQHRHRQPSDHRPGLARPDAAGGGHYHQQLRAQRAVLPAAVLIAVSAPLVARPLAVVALAPAPASVTANSRAPPSFLD